MHWWWYGWAFVRKCWYFWSMRIRHITDDLSRTNTTTCQHFHHKSVKTKPIYDICYDFIHVRFFSLFTFIYTRNSVLTCFVILKAICLKCWGISYLFTQYKSIFFLLHYSFVCTFFHRNWSSWRWRWRWIWWFWWVDWSRWWQ